MSAPDYEDFVQDVGNDGGRSWRAEVVEAGVDVVVPDASWMPHGRSVHLARRALEDLSALAAAAVTHLTTVVDLARAGLEGGPEPLALSCDARAGTVALDLGWDSDPEHLWTVTFRRRRARWRPIGFGRRLREVPE